MEGENSDNGEHIEQQGGNSFGKSSNNVDQRDLTATPPPSDNTDQSSGLEAQKTPPHDTYNKPPISQSLDDDEAKKMFLRRLVQTISTVDMPYTSTDYQGFDATLKQKSSQPPYTSRYNRPKTAYKRSMNGKPSTSNAADNEDQRDLDAIPLTDQCSGLKAKKTSPNDTYKKSSKSQSLDDEEAKMFVLKLSQAILKAKDEQKFVHIPSTSTHQQRFDVMLKQQASQEPCTSGYNRPKIVYKRATNEEPSTSRKTYSKTGKSVAVNMEGGNIDDDDQSDEQEDLDATPPPSDNTDQCSGLEAKKTPPHDTYNKPAKSQSLDDDEAKRMFLRKLIETISNANGEEKSTVDMPYTSTDQEHFDVTLKQKASQPPYTSRYNRPKITYKRAMIEKRSTSNAADNVDQRDLDATPLTDQCSGLNAKKTPPNDTYKKPSKSRSLDDEEAKMFLLKLDQAISNAKSEQKSTVRIPFTSTHHQRFDVIVKQQASQKPSTSGYNRPKIVYKTSTNEEPSTCMKTYSKAGKSVAVNMEGGNIEDDDQKGNHFGKCSNNINQGDLDATPPPSDNTDQCSELNKPPKSQSLNDEEAKRMFLQRLIETISNANGEEKSTVDMPYTSIHQEGFDVTLKQKAAQPPYTSRYNRPKIAYKRAMIEKLSTSNAADNVDERDLEATPPPSNDTDQYSELKQKTTPLKDTYNKPSKSQSLDDCKLKRKASQKPSTSGDNKPKIAYKKATNGKRSRSLETYSQKGKTDEAKESEGTDSKYKVKLRGKKTEKF